MNNSFHRLYGDTHTGITPAELTQTTSTKSFNKKKWLKVIEFAIVGFALWLNPSASFLIFLLKLCFQILHTLPDDRK
jgi:hypothetical protein